MLYFIGLANYTILHKNISPASSTFVHNTLSMCVRGKRGSREGPGKVPLREAKTKTDGAESQQHGGGTTGPKS